MSSDKSTLETGQNMPAYTLDKSSENHSSGEETVVVLPRSRRLKRPAPSCHLCDREKCDKQEETPQ